VAVCAWWIGGGALLVSLGWIDFFVAGELGEPMEATPLELACSGALFLLGFAFGMHRTNRRQLTGGQSNGADQVR
jgi:hypothetical protein